MDRGRLLRHHQDVNDQTVYLVEDHVNQDAEQLEMRYWAHVYSSRDKAIEGVEYYAELGGHGQVTWIDRGPVDYGYDADGEELYRVVPLSVWPDDRAHA